MVVTQLAERSAVWIQSSAKFQTVHCWKDEKEAGNGPLKKFSSPQSCFLSLSLSLSLSGVPECLKTNKQARTPVSFSDFVCQENIWINKKYCFKTTQIVNPNEV